MPVDHTKNRENAHQLDAVESATTPTLQGRTTKHKIDEVDFESFCKKGLGGANFRAIVPSIVADDEAALIKGYRQPTNHDDDDAGHLPVEPEGDVVSRESFVSANSCKTEGYPRLVADSKNRRLSLDGKGLENPRNPFFLFRGVRATNALFD